MKIRLVAFGIAKEILEGSKAEIELDEKANISDLKSKLTSRYPAFSDLASLRFAINEDYQEDGYELNENDEVVIIPPVSGG